MNEHELIERLIGWNLLVVSLTVHEWAHAWSADKLGDDTARYMGRLSFNPLVHIDLVGTVILPLMGAPIGWAKPVPVVPDRFRPGISRSWGMLLTAIAGPISNLVLAIGGMVLVALATHLAMRNFEAYEVIERIGLQFVLLNLSLAVFNMLPIPPLDGSRVVNHFLPYRWRDAWAQFESMGMFVLMGWLLFERARGTSIISGPVKALFLLLKQLVSPLMAI